MDCATVLAATGKERPGAATTFCSIFACVVIVLVVLLVASFIEDIEETAPEETDVEIVPICSAVFIAVGPLPPVEVLEIACCWWFGGPMVLRRLAIVASMPREPLVVAVADSSSLLSVSASLSDVVTSGFSYCRRRSSRKLRSRVTLRRRR